jgi:hypothetical protein
MPHTNSPETTEQVAPEDLSMIELILLVRAFISARRIAISVILAGGLALGGLAAVFFYPWVVQLSIRNMDGAFDFNSTKSIQVGLRSLGSELLRHEEPQEIAKKVELKLEAPNWIEQNVTPEFSVSKSDLRSSNLPDQAQQNAGQSSQITYFTIKVTDADAFQAERQAKLIASLVVRYSMREQFIDILTSLRRAVQTDWEKDAAAIPNLQLGLKATSRHLDLAKDVSGNLAAQSQNTKIMQSEFPCQIANGVDQTIYLPIDTQINGLQIQTGLQNALIDQLSFKLAFNHWLEERMSKAIDVILSDTMMSNYADTLTQLNYWDPSGILNQAEHKNDNWKRDYAANSVQAILIRIQGVKNRYKLIDANNYLIIVKPAYSTSIFIAIGVLVALLGIAMLGFLDLLHSKYSTTKQTLIKAI